MTNGIEQGPRERARGAGFGPGRPMIDRGAIEKLFNSPLPHSLEAEMALLGSIILDPTAMAEVVQIVPNAEHFYSEAHGAVYDSLLTLYEKHQQGDLVQLADLLKGRGALESVGGPDFLVRLAEQVPSSANAAHYARLVAEKRRLRRLIDAAGQTIYEAFHHAQAGPDGGREVLDAAEQRIFEIADETDNDEAAKLSDLLQKAMDLLEESEGRPITGLGSGYYDLDHLMGGLQPGELIILAARPSMGKTALALNLAEQVALRGGRGDGASGGEKAPVLFFSMEMSRQAVAQRFLSAHSGVDSHLMRANRLGAQHYEKLIGACGTLAEAPLFIDDSPSLSVMQLRARARRLKARFGVRCIFIDYLQLMTAPGSARESRQVEVSAISRGVKALARELNVPVVCLSQLNRAAEAREGHRPRMSDLRESGSIEQDADVIMLLHREEYYHIGDDQWFEQNPEGAGLAEVIIAKQRNGPTGTVKLTWDAATTRFHNHSGRASEEFSPRPPRNGAVTTRPFTPAPPGVAAAPVAGNGPGRIERAPTGPVDGFRDGGGPDRDLLPGEDDSGEAPF